MQRLVLTIGVTFLGNVLMCWLLTTSWIANPLTDLVFFLVGTLAIGSWGMDYIESGEK